MVFILITAQNGQVGLFAGVVFINALGVRTDYRIAQAMKRAEAAARAAAAAERRKVRKTLQVEEKKAMLASKCGGSSGDGKRPAGERGQGGGADSKGKTGGG